MLQEMKKVFFPTLSKIARCVALLSLLVLSSVTAWSQSAKNMPAPPTHVQATDGVFTDRIDVSWTKEEGNEYRIYRGTTPSVADMKEVSPEWRTFNYFSDRSRLAAGKHYFYRVKTRKNGHLSAFSVADEGFTQLVAGSRKVVTKSDTERLSDSTLPIELTVNKLGKDTVKAGDNFDISYALFNRSKAIVENAALYFYLSTDDLLDKDDVLLNATPLDPLSIERFRRGAVNLQTNLKTPCGAYFILIKLEPTPTIVSKKIIIK
jgi:hypothetical protein